MSRHSQVKHGLAGAAFELGTDWLEDDEAPTARDVAVTSGAHAVGQTAGYAVTRVAQHVGGKMVADTAARELAPAVMMASVSRAATGQVGPALAANVTRAAGEVVKTQSRVAVGTQFGAGVVIAPAIEVAHLLFDDEEHDADEYAEAVGRGVVTGVVSTGATWAVTGMLAGSVVPGVGTALGWLAGAVAGYVVSTALQS